ncbi:MAG: hypothetical protein GXP28_07175 [Planctomycetes bacterium]|nr:hypothetical protein [Planctomycetota bacterium]
MQLKKYIHCNGMCGQTAWSVLLAALLAGCGGSNQGLVPVSGKVSLDDGPMPAAGRLLFVSVDGAQGLRPAIANFDSSGSFTVQSFKPGDGLESGTYAVSVTCWKVPPTMGGPPAVSHLPAKYKNPSTSGLQLTVPADDRSSITFLVRLTNAK